MMNQQLHHVQLVVAERVMPMLGVRTILVASVVTVSRPTWAMAKNASSQVGDMFCVESQYLINGLNSAAKCNIGMVMLCVCR